MKSFRNQIASPAVLAALSALLAAPAAHAHTYGPTAAEALAGPARLIETGDGSAPFWATPLERAELSRRAHENGRCGGYLDITEHAELRPQFEPPLFLLDRPEPTNARAIEALLPQLSSRNLHATITQLSNFHNRYYTSDNALKSAEWIADRFREHAGKRTDVQVTLYQHRFKMPSVIARIPGQGALAQEIVVIGGHADSINHNGFFPNPNARAPGADDNASGTATLIETFRVLMENGFRPERTVEFMAYAGEEAGLLGSQDIANRYRQQGNRVVAVMQLDMTMFPGPGKEMVMITDNVSPELTRFTMKLIETYVKVPVREDVCGYACSDHASWTRAGYPAVFPFEAMFNNMNKSIHTANDTIEKLDMDFGLHFTKLATAFAVELSAGK